MQYGVCLGPETVLLQKYSCIITFLGQLSRYICTQTINVPTAIEAMCIQELQYSDCIVKPAFYKVKVLDFAS